MNFIPQVTKENLIHVLSENFNTLNYKNKLIAKNIKVSSKFNNLF